MMFEIMFETKNASIDNFLTILALNFSQILINIYTMLPSHIKPITRGIFSRCHVFSNLRINLNQPCNQFKHDF
jgi:hypothetical protein